MGYRVSFAGMEFVALGCGALFCPDASALILADLHLGKSERMARRGGALLPPFETHDTLTRLRNVIQETAPERLFLLGDVFDDDHARDTLSTANEKLWKGILASADCTILAGNHDPAAEAEAFLGAVALRHIASHAPDISGHYHPEARLGTTTRPAFLVGRSHMILPAFGTFTGGLAATDPTLATLIGSGIAILTGPTPFAVPMRHLHGSDVR